ncbi:molybdopterin-guanine dinucleotide biosynthesis protein B [Gallibacterium anatis]|uniref:molybdopterin-guanine dinucleotide biosynthesis protein MobB n=1 Tax=Gallibacterium anatis TaxID=750 RepID=UPI0005320634|nr:molybdopterin-guanine dinucleotide biosynthesis protein MobB [Gallibacterium anatis]KGQ38712.1 molybdopterin-guanine dinucleotide biosynthesis protein B [Gallibacterium anatis]
MIPMLGITGYSGTGKTTLLEKLLPLLAARGIRTAVIKHTHHNVQLDKPGKDSWRMQQAGAKQVIMTCDQRWALMTETPALVSLDYLAAQFDPQSVDLILVEGFKQEPIAKILLHRQQLEKPLPEIDTYTIALALDYRLSLSATDVPQLDINQPQQIADFIVKYFNHH